MNPRLEHCYRHTGLVQVFLIENEPWVWWFSFDPASYATFGEWAWVGRAE